MNRELDAEIAEKILGLSVKANKRKNITVFTIGEPNYIDIQGCMELTNPVPFYLSDISAAMDVVEKMFLDDWAIEIKGSELFETERGIMGGWDVIFSCKCGARGRFSADSDILPKAICLAALKTID
jgi:hypothetical protein